MKTNDTAARPTPVPNEPAAPHRPPPADPPASPLLWTGPEAVPCFHALIRCRLLELMSAAADSASDFHSRCRVDPSYRRRIVKDDSIEFSFMTLLYLLHATHCSCGALFVQAEAEMAQRHPHLILRG